MDFTVLNWNIGGAKFLQDKPEKRNHTLSQLNSELRGLIRTYHRPEIITLQEIVRYGRSSTHAMDIVHRIPGYRYYPFPLIDSARLSSEAKWNKVRRLGRWPADTFFAQGNAFLLRDDVCHFPVWDLSATNSHRPGAGRHFVEQVDLHSGLYFGDRNTEPRAALVAHFMYTPSPGRKPLDIFVVNVHLTTLVLEREGIPEVDLRASNLRLSQLDVVLRGIISRYNTWQRQGFPERGERRQPRRGETFDRHEPVWILAGDFNFTPNSIEYETIQRMNFVDVVPLKGRGTKAKGAGNPATLTLDYIFAGPRFMALDPLIAELGIVDNHVDHTVTGSDHYPMYAKIPLAIS